MLCCGTVSVYLQLERLCRLGRAVLRDVKWVPLLSVLHRVWLPCCRTVSRGRESPDDASMVVDRSIGPDVVVPLLAMAVLASSLPAQAVRAPRVLLPVTWSPVCTIRSTAAASPQPGYVARRGDTLLVLDYSDRDLRAWHCDGRELWRLGRAGSGPGEFRTPTGLHVDGHGRVLVHDYETSRVTVIDPRSRATRTVPLDRNVYAIVPHAAGGFVAFPVRGSPFAVVYDSLGKERSRLPRPEGLDGGNSIADGIVVGVGDGLLLAASQVTDRLFLYAPSARRWRSLRGVEPVDYPRVERFRAVLPDGRVEQAIRPGRDTRYTASRVSADRGLLFVDSRSTEPYDRVLDVYGVADGRYCGSLVMPMRVARPSVAGDVLTAIAIEESGVTSVRAWRLDPGVLRPCRAAAG